MNVKKERKPGVCAALRCKEDPTHSVPGLCWDGVPEDERVRLCDRHTEIARTTFGLDEVPGALRPLAGSVSADEAAAVMSGEEGAGPEPLDEGGIEPASVNVLELPREALSIVEDATGEMPVGMPAAELAAEAEEAKGALEAARELQIETQEDLEFAADILRDAKKKAKELEARLKEITAPLRAAEKSVRDLFRPALDFYGTLERELKARIGEVRMRQEEENRRAMELAAQAHASGDAEATNQALATVKNLASVKGVGARLAWDFEIEDESKLPREYLIPNPRAIAAAAKGVETPPEIPGVRWFQKPIVSARSS